MKIVHPERFLMALILATSLAGCATERAIVQYSYVVEPTKGLPEGMKTLYIAPAKVGPTTDAKWSDLSATILKGLVNESHSRYGTDITVTDRRDTQVTFDEADLAAAGMSTKRGGSGGKLLAADGAILSNIEVKTTLAHGAQRTLSGLNVWRAGGRHWRGGSVDVDTEEVETVTRHMTVNTEFKLVDTNNNQVWEHYLPRTYSSTHRTNASPIFGSSQTEAELTPEDQIVAELVERGAREFISRLMRCRIDVEAVVVSSTNKDCISGVKMLRAEEYDAAIGYFKAALANNMDDHQAAYGAGVACEATGRYDRALKFYNRANAGLESRRYRIARDRMKMYAGRSKPNVQ